jgi:hypothetical protein
VTSTSSFLPWQAAAAVELIEDTGRMLAKAAEKPITIAISTVILPVEVARTSLNILRLTEELLEEVVLLLRSARPVVEKVSTAYQTDRFDTVFRTLDQIQYSKDAITRTPIGIARGVLAPVRTSKGGSGRHPSVIPTPPPERANPLFRPGGWLVGTAKAMRYRPADRSGPRALDARPQLQSPNMAVRIAAITVTLPSIAVRTSNPWLRLRGS